MNPPFGVWIGLCVGCGRELGVGGVALLWKKRNKRVHGHGLRALQIRLRIERGLFLESLTESVAMAL